jgi:hypothetical protein
MIFLVIYYLWIILLLHCEKKKFSGLRNNSKYFPHIYKMIKLRKKETKAKKCNNFRVNSAYFLPVLRD